MIYTILFQGLIKLRLAGMCLPVNQKQPRIVAEIRRKFYGIILNTGFPWMNRKTEK